MREVFERMELIFDLVNIENFVVGGFCGVSLAGS